MTKYCVLGGGEELPLREVVETDNVTVIDGCLVMYRYGILVRAFSAGRWDFCFIEGENKDESTKPTTASDCRIPLAVENPVNSRGYQGEGD